MNQNTKCLACGGTAYLLDVVDFNKSCNAHKGYIVPLSGIPVYYVMCDSCNFCFAPQFQSWSDQEFLDKIYNQDYIKFDPEFEEIRPRSNFNLIQSLFGDSKDCIKHLDYGAGNGRLSEMLTREAGWTSLPYDPFPFSNLNLDTLGRFNLITAFEVFEHCPNIDALFSRLQRLLDESGMIFFTTQTLDGHLVEGSRITWWYASPRNGHVTLFSQRSLMVLGAKYGLNFVSFGSAHHCYYKQFPSWAHRLLKQP